MLILLFIFALIRHLNGAPTTVLPLPGDDSTDLYIRENPLHGHLTTRAISDIVISCSATIFACTWTAIHPNIPGPCDSGWEIFKRQVTTMIYAILAPEMITAWALRQHLSARSISKMYNAEIAGITVISPKGPLVQRFTEGIKDWFHRHPAPRLAKEGEVVPWTITHGFFIQMGGFLMCEGGEPKRTLDFDSVHRDGDYDFTSLRFQIQQGQIEAPRITQGEIEDRSKGDGLTKTIVVLQTTWFIAQCIVRWVSSLPVTELEILTLGFAMLNGITYTLWWHKPQSIRLPVYLERKEKVGRSATELLGEVVDEEQSQVQVEPGGTAMTVPGPEKEVAGNDDVEEKGSTMQEYSTGTAAVSAQGVPPAKRSGLSERIEGALSDGCMMVWEIPLFIMFSAFCPLIKMVKPSFSFSSTETDGLRVPMFHLIMIL